MNKSAKLSKFIFIAVLLLIVFYLLFSIFTHKETPPNKQVYRMDFDDPDDFDHDTWLISNWKTFKRDKKILNIHDGFLTLNGTTSQVPMMISKPFDITPNSVITLKRRVRITHGEGTFSGGLAMYQTDDFDLVPPPSDSEWFLRMGDGIVLIEYSYDLISNSERPGRDVFRFLASDWKYHDNFKLLSPKYNEWVEEVLVFDRRVNKITYEIDGERHALNSYKLDRNAIRFLMHPFGTGAGNTIEIDYIEVTIEDKSVR